MFIFSSKLGNSRCAGPNFPFSCIHFCCPHYIIHSLSAVKVSQPTKYSINNKNLQYLNVLRSYHGSDGYSPACHHRGQSFLSELDHVGFAVDKVALGRVSLQVLWFSPALCYLCYILMHSPITSAI
jgi:hypothetical protein